MADNTRQPDTQNPSTTPQHSPAAPTIPPSTQTEGSPDSRPSHETERTPDSVPSTQSERTLNNRPDDPNRTGAKVQVPPGVPPETFRDPGRQTPGAPKVDNRS